MTNKGYLTRRDFLKRSAAVVGVAATATIASTRRPYARFLDGAFKKLYGLDSNGYDFVEELLESSYEKNPNICNLSERQILINTVHNNLLRSLHEIDPGKIRRGLSHIVNNFCSKKTGISEKIGDGNGGNGNGSGGSGNGSSEGSGGRDGGQGGK